MKRNTKIILIVGGGAIFAAFTIIVIGVIAFFVFNSDMVSKSFAQTDYGQVDYDSEDSEDIPEGTQVVVDEQQLQQMDSRYGGAPSQASAPTHASGSGSSLSLKRIQIPDMSMANVPAYAMMIPSAWQVERGFIQWSQDTFYPQPNLRIRGDDHEKIALMPMIMQMYTESRHIQGFQKIPPQGTPPPQDVGQWIVNVIRQTNKSVSNVQLISDERDYPMEELTKRMGGNNASKLESHILTIEYMENGEHLREEIRFDYAHLQPIVNQNIRSITWTIFVRGMIAAKAEKFEAVKPQLMAYAATFQPLPKWWNQMMQARSEIINLRHQEGMAAIHRRGQYYNQISDSQYAAWKNRNQSSDEAQRKRIQGIYEVSDFQDRDGSTVELPFHYKHTYSDGQGNYILSNRYMQNNSQFEEIQPVR